MTDATSIRAARSADVPGIRALMAPEISAGNLLPRDVVSADFLVAEDREGRLVGCVALASLAPGLVELGSLVARRKGLGLGRRLVQAAIDVAKRRGATSVMALTAIPSFFERHGFVAAPERPWMRARRVLGMPAPVPMRAAQAELRAASAKSDACVRCPRLQRCDQTMLIRPLDVARRAHA